MASEEEYQVLLASPSQLTCTFKTFVYFLDGPGDQLLVRHPNGVAGQELTEVQMTVWWSVLL